ncbi:truncated DNA repair protein [Candidatus Jettenia caeni]|uniref:Truncated DNA repair protein n=1 Tax=Candidatus Jettenia caeni TaxID=247490 RepID=I3ILE9_9BACT|nr:truncated DNA repair protein [Candidatus Jettenia caeni]GIL20053.1 MAG: hypothetical protein BroJett041_11670 [Candidatus Jettenia caeni]GJQ45939.1 MAG: hypothetical protein JETCAE04_16930 [Candidatus Jettenia caeni]
MEKGNSFTIHDLPKPERPRERLIKGIGLAKAAQIKACFELGKRQYLESEVEDIDFKNSQSVVKALQAKIKDKAKEHFKLILLLNTRNKIIGISTVSIGTLDSSLVHP